jgi:hypothetical protein
MGIVIELPTVRYGGGGFALWRRGLAPRMLRHTCRGLSYYGGNIDVRSNVVWVGCGVLCVRSHQWTTTLGEGRKFFV